MYLVFRPDDLEFSDNIAEIRSLSIREKEIVREVTVCRAVDGRPFYYHGISCREIPNGFFGVTVLTGPSQGEHRFPQEELVSVSLWLQRPPVIEEEDEDEREDVHGS